LKALMEEGLGDHILLLRLWEGWCAAGFNRDYCRDHGLDLRGMNFAKDIRKQLEGVMAGQQQQSRHSTHSRAAPSGRGDQDSNPAEGARHRQGRSGAGDAEAGDGAGSGRRRHRDGKEDDHDRSRRRHRDGQEDDHDRIPSKRSRGEGEGLASGKAGGGGRGMEMLMRKYVFPSDAHRISAVIQAITTGFAHKLARRLPRHNGYRTLGTGAMVGGGQLAQPHPSCSCLAEDEDGLLPEWIVYHELVATTRPYLRQVCATRYEFVEGLLNKIARVDVQRLSRSGRSPEDGAPKASVAAKPGEAPSTGAEAAEALPARRNDSTAVNAARERYMQRKQQQGASGKR